MSRCTSCHQENRVEARFCSNCGAALEPEIVEPEEFIETEIVEADSSPDVLEPAEFPDPIDEEPEILSADSGPITEDIVQSTTDSIEEDWEEPILDLEENKVVELENDLPLLEIGAWITKRYQIVQNQIEDSLRIYKVEDHGLCPTCGTETLDEPDERFCTACGADLQDESQSRPIVQLEEITEQQSDDMAFTWADRFFRPLDRLASTIEEQPVARKFSSGVNLLAGQRSDVGLLRADQPDEDSIFSLTISGVYESHAQPTIGLYMVADGMGGHGDGEIASRLATETISNLLLQTTIVPLLRGERFSPNTITAHIESAIQDANRRVIEDAETRRNDMGTTVTLLMIIDETAYIANVGDSRTYLWGQSGLELLTQDHSTVFKLFSAGQLEEEAMYTHPKRSEIYRCLGFELGLAVDLFVQEVTPDTTFVLCCDGLWEMVRSEGISDVLMLGMNDPLVVCDELVKRANQAGGEDNISVVVVRATG